MEVMEAPDRIRSLISGFFRQQDNGDPIMPGREDIRIRIFHYKYKTGESSQEVLNEMRKAGNEYRGIYENHLR